MLKYIVLIFSFLIGGYALYSGFFLFRLWLRMKKWLACTHAEVISKKVDKRLKATGARSNFAVYITYRFDANGEIVEGNKVFPIEFMKGQKGFLKKDADKLVNDIPAVTTIYFNPVNPQEHIMFRGGAGFSLLLLFMGIFCLVYGLVYFAIACVPTH